MPIRFDPIVSPLLIALLTIIYAALTLGFYRRFRSIVSRRYWGLLLGAKGLALLFCVALLLNPYRVSTRPDPSTFQVVCLVDASGSMATSDIDGGQRRIDLVKEKLLGDSPFFARFRRQFPNSTVYLFSSDDLHYVDGHTPFDLLPGDTDIDSVLQKVLSTQSASLKLGAVLLITDGLDNRGRPVVEAGPPYKAAGVPIHSIGIGDRQPMADLAVRLLPPAEKAVKARPFTLVAEVSRNTDGPLQTELELYEDSRLVGTRPVSFGAGATTVQVSLEHTSYTAGFKTFKVQVKPLPGEQNRLNNTDYAGLQIHEPDVFRVLYFTTALDWEYRFLAQLAAEQERFSLDAVIQLGPQTWYVNGLADDQLKGLPPPATLNDYDAVIVNLQALPTLTAAEQDALAGFAENRGGGLIFAGVATELPESLEKIMPIRALPGRIGEGRRTGLDFRGARLLSRPGDTALTTFLQQLYLPQGTPYLPIGVDQLKPGAINLATAKGGDWVALTAQQYGAGKIVLVNVSMTWRWAMDSDASRLWYGNYWAHLIPWSATSLQQRLRISPAGAKLALGTEQEIALDLLDSSYRPDNNAQVTATVILPGGEEQPVNFIHDPRVEGRYVARFAPAQSGEYRWRIGAVLHDGEALEQRTDFIALDASAEQEPAPMAEEQLQSLARTTGGEYWPYQAIDRIQDIPIAAQTRYLEERHYWLASWWFLLVVLLAVLPDWILRRRIGLR